MGNRSINLLVIEFNFIDLIKEYQNYSKAFKLLFNKNVLLFSTYY